MARPKKKIDDVEIKKIELSLKRMQATASHPLRPLWPLIEGLMASGHTLSDIHAHLGGDGLKVDRRSLSSLVRTMDTGAGPPKSHSEKERALKHKLHASAYDNAEVRQQVTQTVPARKDDRPLSSTQVTSPSASSFSSNKEPESGRAEQKLVAQSTGTLPQAPRPVSAGSESRAQGQQLRPDGARPAASLNDDLRDLFRSTPEAPRASSQRANEQLQSPTLTTRRPEAQPNNQGEGPARNAT